MAIEFARVLVHSRSKGHSAVSAAAYRSGQTLFDERKGISVGHHGRHDVAHSEIILPDGASEVFNDRNFLWNEVERAEKRIDAQLCKDYVIALPRELSDTQRLDLARKFAYDQFVSKGIPVDLNIHDKEDGNPHAHILTTTRRLEGDRFSSKKARDLNPVFSNTTGSKGFVSECDFVNKKWRSYQNDYYKANGIDLEVDANHLVPQRHEGRVVNDKEHYLKEENGLSRQASIGIALYEPIAVLNELSSQKSVFTDRDIDAILDKNTETSEQKDSALRALRSHESFIALGPGDDGRERYTIQETIDKESLLSEYSTNLSRQKDAKKVDLSVVNRIISDYTLTNEQADSLMYLAQHKRISNIVGRAGTGKSYLMRATNEMWSNQGFDVHGMAVSGVAAKSLERDSGIKSNTIASYKMKLSKDNWKLDENSIVVMDEAGMTSLDDMFDIVRHVHNSGASLVLVGDHDQLQPVEKGAPFRAIVERAGFAEMSDIQRQKDLKDREVTKRLAQGDIQQAIDHYDNKGQLTIASNEDSAYELVVSDWLKKLEKTRFSEQLILAHRRDDVSNLNSLARSELIKSNQLNGQSILYRTKQGNIDVSVGDRLLFTKNCKHNDLKNGDFCTVTQVFDGKITVNIDGDEDKPRLIDVSQYNHFTYGYATTVHKSQGATRDNVFVYLSGKLWDRFLTYVAFSRHRHYLGIYTSKEHYQDKDALGFYLSRDGIKDNAIDFAYAFLSRRNFDQDKLVGRFVSKIYGAIDKIKDKYLYLANYAEYASKLEIKTDLSEKKKIRQEAKLVAEYVDTRRDLGKRWTEFSELKAAISDNKDDVYRLYQSDEYKDLIKASNYKCEMAYRISQNFPLYERALHLNLTKQEAVLKDAEKYLQIRKVQSFLDAYQTNNAMGMRAFSSEIMTDVKGWYPTLASETSIRGVDVRKVVESAKHQEVLRQYYVLRHKTKDNVKRDALRDLHAYYKLTQANKARWAYILSNQLTDALPKEQLESYALNSAKMDKMAYGLLDKIEHLEEALNIFSITTEDLLISSRRYEQALLKETVSEYAHKLKSIPKEKLAQQILSDKRFYRFVYEFELDWKQISADRKDFVNKLKLSSLNSSERYAFRHVLKYQDARIESAKAWKAYFEAKDATDYPKEKLAIDLNVCRRLNNKRNALAHEIAREPDLYRSFLTEIKVKPAEFEKHVTAFVKENQPKISKKGQKVVLDNARQQLNGEQFYDKKEGKWRAKAVSQALVDMGESFFEQILGFEGEKTSRNNRHYGQGNAISAAIDGERQGSWHSFSSGEGGGPLQLIMSTSHGLNMSFEEALDYGAKIAGLCPTDEAVYIAPKRKVFKAKSKESKDIQSKIKNARHYYESAKPINGTLGERYLKDARGIIGDITNVRFHPRIKDFKTIKDCDKGIKSYHPGIVFAARNEQGEITGTQTILLNGKTANKVDSNSVGAVKRSRGVIQGSAVLVRKGTSNRVILAEGLETALSLQCADKEANIYVTLGNIKNAVHLSWLANQHKTNDIYFAADYDPHTNHANVKVIQEIAQEFKTKYGIKTHIAQPKIKDGVKCDFNDVLKELGAEGVKKQLSFKEVSIQEPVKVIEENTISQRIDKVFSEPSLEMQMRLDRLKELNALTDKPQITEADKLVKEYESALFSYSKEKEPSKKQAHMNKMNQLSQSACSRPEIIDEIQSKHPNYAKTMLKRAKALGKDKDNDIER